MDLTLSSRGDYVVRAAIALGGAWDSGAFRKAREIAEEMALPRTYVPELLGLLAEAASGVPEGDPAGEPHGFVDAGVLGLSGAGRLELRLDLGGGVVLHLVRG